MTSTKSRNIKYALEFLYRLSAEIEALRKSAASGNDLICHKPIQEIILQGVQTEAIDFLCKCRPYAEAIESRRDYLYLDSWAYDIFDDMDVYTWLFDSEIEAAAHGFVPYEYAFENWFTDMFYMDAGVVICGDANKEDLE